MASDSISVEPRADRRQRKPSTEELAAAVGRRNTDYYLDRFRYFASTGKRASWNWPSFFITLIWLFYRRMWGWGLAYWLLLPLILLLLSALLSAVIGDTEIIVAGFYGLQLLVGFIVVPIFSNYIYFRHVLRKVAKAKATFVNQADLITELERTGGANTASAIVFGVLVGVALLGILASISIPAYQDYTVRAQVSEGISLSAAPRAAVSAYILEYGRVPTDNLSAGILQPSEIYGNYVESMSVANGRVDITFGRNANSAIQGATLSFTPYVVSGKVVWRCGSAANPNPSQSDPFAIAGQNYVPGTLTSTPQWLPASCR